MNMSHCPNPNGLRLRPPQSRYPNHHVETDEVCSRGVMEPISEVQEVDVAGFEWAEEHIGYPAPAVARSKGHAGLFSVSNNRCHIQKTDFGSPLSLDIIANQKQGRELRIRERLTVSSTVILVSLVVHLSVVPYPSDIVSERKEGGNKMKYVLYSYLFFATRLPEFWLFVVVLL